MVNSSKPSNHYLYSSSQSAIKRDFASKITNWIEIRKNGQTHKHCASLESCCTLPSIKCCCCCWCCCCCCCCCCKDSKNLATILRLYHNKIVEIGILLQDSKVTWYFLNSFDKYSCVDKCFYLIILILRY